MKERSVQGTIMSIFDYIVKLCIESTHMALDLRDVGCELYRILGLLWSICLGKMPYEMTFHRVLYIVNPVSWLSVSHSVVS